MPINVTFKGFNANTLVVSALSAAIGSQKLKFSQDVVAQLGTNPIFELKRGGNVVYRATVPGSINASASGVTLPDQFAEPPAINLLNGLAPESAALGNILAIGDDFILGSTTAHVSPMNGFKTKILAAGYTGTFVGPNTAQPGAIPVHAQAGFTVFQADGVIATSAAANPTTVIVALGNADIPNGANQITFYLDRLAFQLGAGKRYFVYAPPQRSFHPASYNTLVTNIVSWCNAGAGRFFKNWTDANLIATDFSADNLYLSAAGADKISDLMRNHVQASVITAADTYTLELRNATNSSIGVSAPIRIGGGADYLTASKNLDGTNPVRMSGVVLTPPTILDVGTISQPPASGGTTWSLAEADFAFDRGYGMNTDLMMGMNNGAPGFKSRDVVAMGNEWRNLDRWYDWGNNIGLSDTTYLEYGEPWFIILTSSSSTADGWIEIKDFEAQILYKNDTSWVRFKGKHNEGNPVIWGENYIPAFNGYTVPDENNNLNVTTRAGTDGGFGLFIPYGRAPHCSYGRVKVAGHGNIEGLEVSLTMRTAPSGNSSGFKVCCHVGCDPKYSASPGTDRIAGAEAYAPAIISRTMPVTATWTRHTAHNVHRPDIDVPNHPGYLRRVMSRTRWSNVRCLA